VTCENYDMVKAKDDLLLKFLSAQECLEPVRINSFGVRLELMDPMSVTDVLLNESVGTYLVMRKNIGLEQGIREVFLQLMRFLGE
jgi:hypothetical protein